MDNALLFRYNKIVEAVTYEVSVKIVHSNIICIGIDYEFDSLHLLLLNLCPCLLAICCDNDL